MPSLNDARYSQSLERGLAILAAFTPERPVLGIAEIADHLGMSRSTTHRYVITLLALGYLEQGASRKYRLGLRVTDLGMSALSSIPLSQHARPFLQELREHFSFTTNLGILDGGEVVLLERVHGHRRLRHSFEVAVAIGARLPAHCTAIGKLLLANLPRAAQQELLASITLAPCGPKTITSKRVLREELERIRSTGLATCDEEIAPRLHAIAAPVRDESEEVIAAVNVVAPSSALSVSELTESLGPRLLDTAGRISARLGYRPAGGAGD